MMGTQRNSLPTGKNTLATRGPVAAHRPSADGGQVFHQLCTLHVDLCATQKEPRNPDSVSQASVGRAPCVATMSTSNKQKVHHVKQRSSRVHGRHGQVKVAPASLGNKASRLREWFRTRGHNTHRHFLQGAAYSLGSGAVSLIILWLTGRF